jgi:hypothetical protein
MTNEEFELLPGRQTVEQLCHWRASAAPGAFCCAWSEHPSANQHAAERSDIMRMTADWRASGLVLTFWKRHGERSHLLVQILGSQQMKGSEALRLTSQLRSGS